MYVFRLKLFYIIPFRISTHCTAPYISGTTYVINYYTNDKFVKLKNTYRNNYLFVKLHYFNPCVFSRFLKRKVDKILFEIWKYLKHMSKSDSWDGFFFLGSAISVSPARGTFTITFRKRLFNLNLLAFKDSSIHFLYGSLPTCLGQPLSQRHILSLSSKPQ